jgi:hypothetical protein
MSSQAFCLLDPTNGMNTLKTIKAVGVSPATFSEMDEVF